MKLTDEQKLAVEALNLSGHLASAPYIDFDVDRPDGILIDGVLSAAELRALLEILDPQKCPCCGRDAPWLKRRGV